MTYLSVAYPRNKSVSTHIQQHIRENTADSATVVLQ